jgi:mono/diheme cytochrome c family protein
MHRVISAGTRALCAATAIFIVAFARADAVPVFANGQGVSCEMCHTTFPGMTRYGMMVMMTNFQILNRHLQDKALPIAARIYITSLLGNKSNPGSTTVSDFSLLGGGFLGRNFTWYGEQHVIDSGQIGQTEQLWLSWNGLFGGTNSLQIGKFHTPFPFMPAHAWTIGRYLLATQTTGQNDFNPNDARWGVALDGMSNEFMYNLSYLTNSGPTGTALDYNQARYGRTLDANISYGGMTIPWSVGVVAIRGFAPLSDPSTAAFAGADAFTREGLYFGYQTSLWHYQTMYYHGQDEHPDLGSYNVPLNGFFFEVERDLGWRNHVLLRYDVASSDTLNRQYVLDLSHNVEPNFALIGELAVSPNARPQIALQIAYAGPYEPRAQQLAVAQATAAQATVAPAPSIAPTATGDANAGAKLVQANGCEGCHGVGLKGGMAPALYGIEHRRSADAIAQFIAAPKSPMPNFGFNAKQIADIVAYLSNKDGGIANTAPIVTLDPPNPTDIATVRVTFPGTPPLHVTVTPIMVMGGTTMPTREVPMTPSPGNPNIFVGKIVFSMGGPWTVRIRYDGQILDVPLTVGS